jgi:hypothetical protein
MNYKRNCPVCNKELYYSSKDSLSNSIRRNGVCRSCSKKGKPTWILGKHHTEETKKKLSINHHDNSAWSRGKSLSLNHRLNLSSSKIGHVVSDETKKKLSLSLRGRKGIWKGKKLSNDHIRKLRIAKLKKVELLGISTKEDIGAKQYFDLINTNGFGFKPKRFWDLGYDADGYDENKHIWCEFDTPYHNYPYQQKKDLTRQENIIKHFELSGNPLTEFIRVSADKNGSVLNTKCVYKGNCHGVER